MRGLLLLAALGGLTGCQTMAPAPAIERVTERCPVEPPPEIPALPERPDDLRELAPDRVRIEGIHASIAIRQAAYLLAWEDCE